MPYGKGHGKKSKGYKRQGKRLVEKSGAKIRAESRNPNRKMR